MTFGIGMRVFLYGAFPGVSWMFHLVCGIEKWGEFMTIKTWIGAWKKGNNS
jgi:hypothetical protein